MPDNEVMKVTKAGKGHKGFIIALIKTIIMLAFVFAIRYLGSYLIGVFADYTTLTDPTLFYVVQLILSAIFVYFLPFVVTIFIFRLWRRDWTIGKVYKKPRRLSLYISSLPMMYGLGLLVNILTITVMYFFSTNADITKSLESNALVNTTDFNAALAMFVYTAFLAPIFEELWLRQVLLKELLPYGPVKAIVLQALVFGVMHGNIQQFFYTTVIGLILGYITYVSGSILASTLLHCFFNSIAGIMLLLLTTPAVKTLVGNQMTGDIPDADKPVVAVFAVYCVIALAIALIGLITAIPKIKQLRRCGAALR